MKTVTTTLQTLTAVLLVNLSLQAQALTSGPQGQTPPKAAATGTVLRSTTGDPVSRATVTLARAAGGANPAAAGQRGAQAQPIPGGQVPQPQAQPIPNLTVTTDDLGRFQITEIEPGPYRLIAARNGFSRQEYGQRALNRPGTVLNIAAGQQIADVVFRLTPASTITGRVLDSNGEPLVGVTVQALRSTYDATGKRTLQPTASGRTNDLGEYRLYWINPGRYLVSANSARSGLELISASASQAATQAQSPEQAQAAALAGSLFGPGANPNEVLDTSFGLTYYPGTADPSRAVAVDLQPGYEARAIDFTLARTQRVKLTGRVLSADTGRPPQMAQVSISSRDSSTSSPLDALIGIDPGSTRYNPATGEFTIQNVAPGSYWLQVISQGQPNSPPPQGQPTPPEALAVLSRITTARVPVEVLGSEISDLNVTVSSGTAMPGQLRVEGASPGAAPPITGISISLQSTTGGASLLTLLQGGVVRPAADGTFSIPQVTTGDYKLSVSGLGANFYLKEARYGQTDVLQSGLSISPPVSGALEIVLGATPGQIAGTVANASLNPVPGVQVVLVPDLLRNRQDLYKTATTDQSGRFTVRGITPGDYRVFAWEDLEPFSYFDPAVLQQYEQQGKLVRVQDSASETVDLRLIPAAGQ